MKQRKLVAKACCPTYSSFFLRYFHFLSLLFSVTQSPLFVNEVRRYRWMDNIKDYQESIALVREEEKNIKKYKDTYKKWLKRN